MKTLIWKALARLAAERSGATVIEYCLIAGCIALAIIGSVTSLGEATNENFTAVQAGWN